MKNKFPGYCRKSDDEISNMWTNGIICFDANVFLNLYRYSSDTKDEFIRLIEKLSDQILLPHQAALEYNRNRYEVIAEQEKAYREFTSKLDQIEEDLKSTSKPPFLSKRNHNALQKVFENVKAEVKQSIEKYKDYLKNDEIFERLSNLFEGKILEAFDDKEVEKIYKEGAERFEKKLPPGYEDEKTKKDDRKYGDFILWKQLIQIANEKKAPLILITDERKEDWWWKLRDGRTMGPRYELVQEMKIIANVDFHMYSSERFLEYGLKHLNVNINKKAIEELQEVARTERSLIREKTIWANNIFEQKFAESKALERFKFIDNELEKINQSINSFKHGINIYKNEPILNPEQQESIIDISISLQKMEEKVNMLLKERNQLIEILSLRKGFLDRLDPEDK